MNTYRTDFENMSIPTLKGIHNGITHKVEVLQQKMSGDMEIPTCLNILPRNYTILPVGRCSLHDLSLLEELHEKRFDCFWTMKQKEAEAKGDLETFNAEFKLYSFFDVLNDNELNKFYQKAQEKNGGSIMTSHMIVEELKRNPDYLEEVML